MEDVSVGFAHSHFARDHHRVKHAVENVVWVRIAPGVGQQSCADAAVPGAAHQRSHVVRMLKVAEEAVHEAGARHRPTDPLGQCGRERGLEIRHAGFAPLQGVNRVDRGAGAQPLCHHGGEIGGLETLVQRPGTHH